LPRAAELDVLLQETQAEQNRPENGARVRDLMDRLSRYGESQMARVALDPKENDYYEWVGRALLSGIAELLGRIDLFTARPILFVADARKRSSGAWLIEQFELRGEAPLRLESLLLPPDLSSAQVPLPERVYLGGSLSSEETQSLRDIRPLSPWLYFEPEGNEFFFLNAVAGPGEVEYLCYTTGRMLRGLPVGNVAHPLWDGMLGISGVAETLDIAADPSQRDQSHAPLIPPARNPRRLGEFELVSCLGRGGMGVVYRAWHLPLKRQVGLKCMLRSGDPKSEARFAREIRALGRVDHPNLVKIYSSGTDGDQLFYAMELVEGTDLLTVCLQLRSTTGSNPKSADWDQAVNEACRATKGREQALDTDLFGPGTTATMQIQIGPEGVQPAFAESLPKSETAPPADSKVGKPSLSHSRNYVDRVVEVIRQVAEAVHALHEANIVHRDIKPGNIMVTRDGKQAVLMDLGLAQLADETEGRLTHTLDYVGTLRYSSPEQLRAAHHVDLRTDIYSLGATFWELLTLQPLFGAGRATSPARLMIDIQSSAPSRPRHFNPRIPADLEIIVLKCLEKDPARRYSSAGELAADLRRWQLGLPVQAQPPTLRYILGQAHPTALGAAVHAGSGPVHRRACRIVVCLPVERSP
jgi:serine/threonine protein kinase